MMRRAHGGHPGREDSRFGQQEGKAMLEVTPKRKEESAKEYVRRQMMNNIVSLRLAPGQQLDADELCSLFSVSRNPVREAELDLNLAGLVEIRPKVGAFVTKIDPVLIEGIQSMKLLIGQRLAEEACVCRTDDQISYLRLNIRSTRSCFDTDPQRAFELDRQFRDTLYKICHREVWGEMVGRYQPHYDRIRMMEYAIRKDPGFLDANEALTDAIEKRDKEAAVRAVVGGGVEYRSNVIRLYDVYGEFFTPGFSPDVEEARAAQA